MRSSCALDVNQQLEKRRAWCLGRGRTRSHHLVEHAQNDMRRMPREQRFDVLQGVIWNFIHIELFHDGHVRGRWRGWLRGCAAHGHRTSQETAGGKSLATRRPPTNDGHGNRGGQARGGGMGMLYGFLFEVRQTGCTREKQAREQIVRIGGLDRR